MPEQQQQTKPMGELWPTLELRLKRLPDGTETIVQKQVEVERSASSYTGGPQVTPTGRYIWNIPQYLEERLGVLFD